MEIYNSLKYILGTRPRSFMSGNICFEFSVQCTSPIALSLRKKKMYLHTLEKWVGMLSSRVITKFPSNVLDLKMIQDMKKKFWETVTERFSCGKLLRKKLFLLLDKCYIRNAIQKIRKNTSNLSELLLEIYKKWIQSQY